MKETKQSGTCSIVMMSLVVSENHSTMKKPPLERKDTLTDILNDVAGLPDINALEDVCDAIDICEERGIPYDELDDLEDFKDRIRLNILKSKRLESRKIEVCTLCFNKYCQIANAKTTLAV